LIPRLTQFQRNLITSPTTGLLIFQTDNTPGFYYYNGSTWTSIGGGIANENDPVFTTSVAGGITLSNTNNWNTAYSWGNHTGLYRPLNWVPAWTDVTGKPNPYIAGSGISLSGDTLYNTLPNLNHTGDAVGSGALTVVKLQGRDVSGTAPASGQVLKWNGSSWIPDTDNNTALPASTSNTTLRHNGSGWAVSSLFYNTDSRIGIGIAAPNQQLEITQNFRLPASTASVGNIYKDANLFIHNKGTENIFLGVNSGNLTSTGNYNTALGAYSLYSNTTGNFQTAIGASALRSNTSGMQNTAIGYWSMYSNTTGNYNTALGYRSLNGNTSGFENTAIGYQSMLNTNTGYANTALGYQSLYSNTVGIDNTAVGDYALRSNISGNDNTATGFFALNLNTSGSNNTANGTLTLNSNTTGYNNTAIGYSALYSNTGGYENTANGKDALLSNTSGIRNSAIGVEALYSNQTGNLNTAMGWRAMKNNTTGLNNSAFGTSSLQINTTGSNNTSIGYNAGYSNSSGSGNVFLGHKAGYNETGSNKLVINNSDTGAPLISGDFSAKNVSINTVTPHNSAVFEVNSTTKGVILPKLSIEQILAIASPDTGLIVYNTTSDNYVFFNGYQWRALSDGGCIPSPSEAIAGSNLTVSGYPVLLNATQPTVGIGKWSIISGSGGIIADTLNPHSSFTGNQGVEYVLKWTVSNACKTNSANITILLPPSLTVDAGPSIFGSCTDVSLNASTVPPGYTGIWTIVSGQGGLFYKKRIDSTHHEAVGMMPGYYTYSITNVEEIHKPICYFSGNPGVTYLLKWTVSNSLISKSDSLTVSFSDSTTISNAGNDINTSDPFAFAVTLSANAPHSGETGAWAIVKGPYGSFSNKYHPNSLFNIIYNRSYTLSWTITSPCKIITSFVNINTGPLSHPIIFNGSTYYVYPVGDNGDSVIWGGNSLLGALSDSNGLINTNRIVDSLGNNNGIAYAAKICHDLNYGGYNDWYLPSIVELKEIILNNASVINNFSTGSTYLSSTELTNNTIKTYLYATNTNNYSYIYENYNKTSKNGFILYSESNGSVWGNQWGGTVTNGINNYGANKVRCIRKQ